MDGTSRSTKRLSKEEALRLRQQYIGPSCTLFYKKNPLKIARAEGQYMYDEEGTAYLDCINNVCHVGHCHPTVVGAATEQMRQLNTNSRFLHDNLVTLAQRLVSTMPPSLCMVYLTNSGSEANDLAIRLARHHTKATEIITLDRAYHGHLMSLIDISSYKLKGMVDGVHKQPDFVHMAEVPDSYRGKYRDTDHNEEELCDLYVEEVNKIISSCHEKDKNVCCFIAESMQSCGGQILYPKGYLDKVCKTIQAAGGCAIADEVQVGFGRVGTHLWSFDAQGCVPDIVTMGKPMGNGHPISAVITTREIAASFEACGVEYFNTYGGNPVSCAIGLAVLDVIEEDKLQENACRIGKEMEKRLLALKDKHTIIGDIRGVGMFWGVELVKDRTTREPATEKANEIVRRMKEEHILLSRDGPDENVLKFKPPMCFNLENLDTLLTALDSMLTDTTDSKLDTNQNQSEVTKKVNGNGVKIIESSVIDTDEPLAKRSCHNEHLVSSVKVH